MVWSKVKKRHSYVMAEMNKDKWNGKKNVWTYSKVALDLSRSMSQYNLMPEEYIALDFYDLDKDRREKIIPRKERDQYVKAFNRQEDVPKLENKKNFLKNFHKYLNRDFLLLEETTFPEYEDFYKNHGGFVAKVSDSGQGKGVQIITEVGDLKQEYHRLVSNSFDLVEEIVIPHPELKRMNPVGLPSLRLITFVDNEGVPHIVSSAINLSFDDPVVNTFRGGVKALINPENGIVVTDAIGKTSKVYTHHPVSNVKVKGFQVPQWEELKTMLLSAAKEIPTVRYVGWDCSVSEKGPLIIEANAKRPDINGIQIYGYKKADEQYSIFDFVRSEFQKSAKEG